MRVPSFFAFLVSLTACAQLTEGPSLAGYPGLQWQIESFYSARALEENATCTLPRMTITGYQIVEDTPERIVMNVRYHYIDQGMRDFDNDVIGGPRFRFGTGTCNDFAERTFVISKAKGPGTEDGMPKVFVSSMTGPQRQLPPGSALG